jgi:hypothetical protein
MRVILSFMRVIFWFIRVIFGSEGLYSGSKGGVICYPYSMFTTSSPRERDVVKKGEKGNLSNFCSH